MEEAKEVQYELIRPEPTTTADAEQFPIYGGMLTPEIVARAEAAVEMVKKIKATAFRVTNHKDWIRMGGNAYLTESGCKKVGMLFGVSYRGAKVMSEDRTEGTAPVRQYTAKVSVYFNGREIEEIGTCDSNYDLYRWAGKDGDGNKIECPFAERDFTSMQKHALTNAMNRALKAILGLNGITWEEVQVALGQEGAGKAANVGFDKGGAAPKKAVQTVDAADARDTRQKLQDLITEMAGGDAGQAKAILEEATGFISKKDGKQVKGFSDPFNPKISDSWIQAAYGKLKKQHSEQFPDEPGMNG